jgi:hypothetical protein
VIAGGISGFGGTGGGALAGEGTAPPAPISATGTLGSRCSVVNRTSKATSSSASWSLSTLNS